MEWLVRFAVVNVLTELHFVAGGHWRAWLSWLRRLRLVGLEALRLRSNPGADMVDDVLSLVGLVHIPPGSQLALSVLGVAVVEIDQELLKQ